MSKIAKYWLRKSDGAKFEVTQQPHCVDGTEFVGVRSSECNDGVITLDSLHRYFEVDGFAEMAETIRGDGLFGSSVSREIIDYREAQAAYHEAEAAACRRGDRDQSDAGDVELWTAIARNQAALINGDAGPKRLSEALAELRDVLADAANGHPGGPAAFWSEFDRMTEEAKDADPSVVEREPNWNGRVHRLKTWPEFFDAIARGEKTFEFRRDDRDFKKGDVLWLEKYCPIAREHLGPRLRKVVTYVLDTSNWIGGATDGKWVCLGIADLCPAQPDPSVVAEGTVAS